MGIAAYNRGSNAIRQQTDIAIHGRVMDFRKPAPVPFVSQLPEGILRSSFLPENDLSGTAIFLRYQAGWYIVETRWQILKRRRSLASAAKIFEGLEMYGLCALERA